TTREIHRCFDPGVPIADWLRPGPTDTRRIHPHAAGPRSGPRTPRGDLSHATPPSSAAGTAGHGRLLRVASTPGPLHRRVHDLAGHHGQLGVFALTHLPQ